MLTNMKKIFLLIVFLIGISFVHQVAAASKPQVSLSDAIYADLAISHNLDNVSIYFTDGKSSDDVRLNETQHWLPASTVKLFTAMYAYKLINNKTINLTDTATIADKNEVPTELVTPDLPTLLTGETVTIDRLIRQMLIQSDNTAYNQLLDLLGRDNVTKYLQDLGLTHTHIGSKLNLDESQTQYEYDVVGYGINTTTAEDYAKAFLLIKQNKIPGAKDLFTVLQQQRINTMIPLYLPKQVVCAHKTGDLAPIYHDGGICQDKKQSYVITIFTNAGDPNLLAHLSEIAYTRNYNLVGQNPDNPTLSIAHSVDPLAMTKPSKHVLGANTSNFPVPDITAADLGVKASDLSLTISTKDLPPVLIPADSPFHGLTSAWEVAQVLFAPGAAARRDVNIADAKLRLAEAQDLIKRGKTQEAQQVVASIQNGLQVIAQDPTIKGNPVAQNTLQAISETRFTTLNTSLQNSKGDQKLEIIKQIATEAKQTIQTVQPQLPEANNAINPSQKALVATVISSTPTEAVVKTSGGQIITVPLNSPAITVKNSSTLNAVTPTPSISPVPTAAVSPTNVTPTISAGPSISPTPTNEGLAVGSTVALVGTNKDNTFAPTLIIPNVPRELVAPQPVVVAKVASDHLVVEENGIYTQVNVNPTTTVRAADTNIPLTQIQPGDVVVVHGDPLTPVVNTPISPTPSAGSAPVTPTGAATVTPHVVNQTTIGVPTGSTTVVTPTRGIITPVLTIHPTTTAKITILPTGAPKVTVPVPTTATKAPIALPTPGPVAPSVINGTSIRVIEQHQNVNLPLPSQQAKPSAPAQPQNTAPSTQQHTSQPAAPAAQAPQAPAANLPKHSGGKK